MFSGFLGVLLILSHSHLKKHFAKILCLVLFDMCILGCPDFSSIFVNFLRYVTYVSHTMLSHTTPNSYLQKMLSNDAHIAYHVQTNTNKQKYLAHYLFCNIFCILSDFYWNPIGIPDSYRILVKLGGTVKYCPSPHFPFSPSQL